MLNELTLEEKALTANRNFPEPSVVTPAGNDPPLMNGDPGIGVRLHLLSKLNPTMELFPPKYAKFPCCVVAAPTTLVWPVAATGEPGALEREPSRATCMALTEASPPATKRQEPWEPRAIL